MPGRWGWGWGRGGKREGAEPEANFLARRFFLDGGVRLFLGAGTPTRACPSGRPPAVPLGQVPGEGGPETLTGPLSKATKVLSVPRLKPAEPALQKFIQQVRAPAARLSVCLSRCPAPLRLCGRRDLAGPASRGRAGALGKGAAARIEWGNPGRRLTLPRPRRCDPSLVSTRGCPRPRCMKPGPRQSRDFRG